MNRERFFLILEVLFWIPVWTIGGAVLSLIGGLKDARKSWEYFKNE